MSWIWKQFLCRNFSVVKHNTDVSIYSITILHINGHGKIAGRPFGLMNLKSMVSLTAASYLFKQCSETLKSLLKKKM